MNRYLALLLGALLLAACGGSGSSVFSLPVGTCFDDQTSEQISSVPEVDCSEPHDNEVFALINYADSDTFPGATEMEEIANDLCIDQFEAYVGLDYASSELAVFPIYPTEASWEDGDREIICALYNADLAKLTGSMQGANR